MLPPEFATTGYHAHRLDTPITRFQVLGERSTGTNFVKRLLGRNSALKPTEALGWKHGFPHMMAIPANLAVICVVRGAENWALSMFAKPWHTTPQMQRLPFAEFIRAPWDTVIDRQRYFVGAQEAGTIGQTLQQDRDPITGAQFANLFALRKAKMTGLVSYLNRDCTCIIMRMEEVQKAPEATLDRMLQTLGQPDRTEAFRPILRRLGANFNPSVEQRPTFPTEMTAQDRAFMNSQLDPEFEARFGYGPTHS